MSNIQYFFHCGVCLKDKPDNTSAKDYMRLEIGLTSAGGIQVWCLRHNLEVCLINDLPKLRQVILGTGCKNHPQN